MPLARLARAGALPTAYAPTGDDAAMGDLARAREAAGSELQDAKCRRKAVWRRHALRDVGQAPGGPARLRWLSDVVGPTPAQPIVLQEYVRAVQEPSERLQRLAQARQAQVKAWRLRPMVEAPQALRGVQCTVAVTMAAGIGGLTRAEDPRALMKPLGLMPSESTRAARRRHGTMTTAGNAHARSAMGEGAWASRDPAKLSRHRHRRLDTPPKMPRDIRWKAQARRCKRSRRPVARGEHARVVIVAMARALVGCLWAIAQQVPPAASAHRADRHYPRTAEGLPPCLGSGAAPAWRAPRRREAAGRGFSSLARGRPPTAARQVVANCCVRQITGGSSIATSVVHDLIHHRAG